MAAVVGAILSVCLSADQTLAASNGDSLFDPRAAIAASRAIAPDGIDELKAVEIGGIEQWVSVRGSDPANPILLFIHGGPGSPMMPVSWTFQRPWEDFFTVVQWDQRGAGKTFSSAKRQPDTSMSIDQMQADTEELIDILRRTFGKDKIFLMGHSWGSILGIRVAQHRPEWLHAYIGVGQVVNGKRNEVVSYQETLAQAEAAGNNLAIKELKAIAPYPSSYGATPLAKTMVERKWVIALGGMLYGKTNVDESIFRALSPDYNDYDVGSTELGELSSIEILLPQAEAVNFDDITVFKCPIYFFAGAHDRTTPTSIVVEFFNRIEAPQKDLFIIDRAAHYVVNESPGEVLLYLVRHVRPLSRNNGNY
ncbi:MAG: alpha/beta hydrolase [bacterium]|nr:MAG: alpha/beta hydrolase [bacterium]